MIGKIIDKKEVALGTLQVTFAVDEDFTFIPGQFCFVTLPKLHHDDERGPRRHFSILNSPLETGIIKIATRIREESGFKKTLRDLPIGSEVTIDKISGKFVLPESTTRHYICIAGGIGITPFMSMLQYVADNNLSHKITLVYSNKNKESTAFFEQLKELETQIPGLEIIFVMTQEESWEGEKGRVNKEFIKRTFPELGKYSFMVVGPPAMANSIVAELKEAGVKEEDIQQENFSGY